MVQPTCAPFWHGLSCISSVSALCFFPASDYSQHTPQELACSVDFLTLSGLCRWVHETANTCEPSPILGPHRAPSPNHQSYAVLPCNANTVSCCAGGFMRPQYAPGPPPNLGPQQHQSPASSHMLSPPRNATPSGSHSSPSQGPQDSRGNMLQGHADPRGRPTQASLDPRQGPSQAPGDPRIHPSQSWSGPAEHRHQPHSGESLLCYANTQMSMLVALHSWGTHLLGTIEIQCSRCVHAMQEV